MSDDIIKITPPKYYNEYFKPETLCDEMQQLLIADQILKKRIKDVQGTCSHEFAKTIDRGFFGREDDSISFQCRKCGMKRWAEPMDIKFE